ncbi:MAG: OmpA family protein [Cellulophaga sp.]
MKTNKINLIVLCFLSIAFSHAQDLELTAKDSIVESSWMAGLGLNFVDDSGDIFDNLVSPSDQWNSVPYPSRLSIGRYFKNGLGIEAIGTINKYKVGKLVDNVVNTKEINYLGLDARLTYDLNKVFGETGWFDPYLGVGLGYTKANDIGRGTYNGVVGFRTWFSDRFGLDFSSSGKWRMADKGTNHIQHAVGVVYQFGIEKGLSKKGLEKKALIEAFEKEQQRITDSTATANKMAEEARLLAERLAKETENARLAAIEKANLDAENERKELLKNKLLNVGIVYFNLNSSYLNRTTKGVLDRLVAVMNTYPSITIGIGSHTDSRGMDEYNMTLSQRRAKRTYDYLISKGITSDRLTSQGFGENKLTNECGNDVTCSGKKHRENRRSEFLIIKY